MNTKNDLALIKSEIGTYEEKASFLPGVLWAVIYTWTFCAGTYGVWLVAKAIQN